MIPFARALAIAATFPLLAAVKCGSVRIPTNFPSSGGGGQQPSQDAPPPPAPGGPVQQFSDDFDGGALSKKWGAEAVDWSRLQVVSNPTRRGSGAFKCTVHPGDVAAGKNRAEIFLHNNDPLNSEAWYRWSVMIPTDYVDRAGSDSFQIIGQFHDQPDTSRGQTWDNYPHHPPMIAMHYGADKTGSGFGLVYGAEPNHKRVAMKYIEKGRWYDVKMHIRWSQSNDGFLECWLNGEPWTPFNGKDHKVYGANMYNNAPAYLKLGLYRGSGFTTANTVYYDEVYAGPTDPG